MLLRDDVTREGDRIARHRRLIVQHILANDGLVVEPLCGGTRASVVLKSWRSVWRNRADDH